ncbi:hypothetical protein J2X68_008062 [Streptomyces sp. 3330]|nr:hypothetical protein [Streptomyces sp. 3330]
MHVLQRRMQYHRLMRLSSLLHFLMSETFFRLYFPRRLGRAGGSSKDLELPGTAVNAGRAQR